MWKYVAACILLINACTNSTETNSSNQPPEASPSGAMTGSGKAVMAPQNQQSVLGGPANFSFQFGNIQSGPLYLVCVVGNQNVRMDSSTIINNVARFENKEGYPQGVYYAVHSDKEFVQFILGADQEFSIRTNLPENLVNTQIEGSKENQLFL